MLEARIMSDKSRKSLSKIFGILAIISLAISAIFGFINPDRFFESYLIAYMFVLAIPLGSLFLILITHLTKAHWAVSIRRIPELLANNFLILTVLFLPLMFGLEHLFHWLEPGAADHDHLIKIKEPYLNMPFFIIRLAIYFITWHLIAKFYTSWSIKQDTSGDKEITKKLQRRAPLSILAYAMTITFAAFDLLMSIEPHWFSTIFGVFYFGICILLALCVISVITIILYKKDILKGVVNISHIHDIGKLIF